MKTSAIFRLTGVKVAPEHRSAVEWIAENRHMSLGEARRFLLDAGITAIGFKYDC
jgi:hypothetical protein